jgi:uncharacterized OB-fold protein
MRDNVLPTPAPTITAETEEFWLSAARGTLVLRRCDACGLIVWYPRSICPDCQASETSWVEASGRGVVYSHTTVRRGLGDYAGAGPYVLAYVQLDEGPRVMTNVVDCEPADVAIGQRVEVAFSAVDDAAALPRFRPVAAT